MKFIGFSIPWMFSCSAPITPQKPCQNFSITLPKSIKNPSKIYLRRHLKQDTILDRSWKALGAILDGFWPQVGGQVGAKLAPKSKNEGPKTMSKKRKAKRSRKFTRVHTSKGGWVPINHKPRASRGQSVGH